MNEMEKACGLCEEDEKCILNFGGEAWGESTTTWETYA
jgi:hypothetical protein